MSWEDQIGWTWFGRIWGTLAFSWGFHSHGAGNGDFPEVPQRPQLIHKQYPECDHCMLHYKARCGPTSMGDQNRL